MFVFFPRLHMLCFICYMFSPRKSNKIINWKYETIILGWVCNGPFVLTQTCLWSEKFENSNLQPCFLSHYKQHIERYFYKKVKIYITRGKLVISQEDTNFRICCSSCILPSNKFLYNRPN